MKIVKVNPFPSFCNGERGTVAGFNLRSVADNLENHVIFKYTLVDANNVQVGEGQYQLVGDDYRAWDSTAADAYRIVAKGIGLEIVNDLAADFGDS